MKVVISSHPRYQHALKLVLDSLNYKDHIDDIIVCVADVPQLEAATLIQNYKESFGLKNVLTSTNNIDEYTAYLSLGDVLEKGGFDGENMFLMIHDTCEAGRLFWNKLKELEKNLNGPKFSYNSETHTFKLDSPVSHVIYTSGGAQVTMQFYEFLYLNGKMMTYCDYEDGGEPKKFFAYLAADNTITQSDENAQLFPDDSLENVNSVLSDSYLWYPVSANFNIGVATRKFILDYARTAFEGKTLTKADSIDIEINTENPLNLQCLAGVRWRFACCAQGDRKVNRIPTMSIWVNDTDVYGDGKKRNVSVIHPLDLKKYSILVGKAWLPSHPSRE